MNSKLYDILCYIQRIALPAVIVFLTTIFQLIGIKEGTTVLVTGIVGAVDVLMGALLKIDSIKYYKQEDEVPNEDDEEE